MPEVGDLTFKEGAAEGRHDNWGEVVTRQPYRKVRLDHLLSKEMEESKGCITVCLLRQTFRENSKNSLNGSAKQILFSGGDALRGHTRSHPEHDG